jgi:Antitoxin Phd_YefM, type II toxin-antitoxin system
MKTIKTMKSYTFTEARKKLAEVLDRARKEDVIIKRRGGESFVLRQQIGKGSPLDVPAVKTKAKSADIIDAVRESRAQSWRNAGKP